MKFMANHSALANFVPICFYLTENHFYLELRGDCELRWIASSGWAYYYWVALVKAFFFKLWYDIFYHFLYEFGVTVSALLKVYLW